MVPAKDSPATLTIQPLADRVVIRPCEEPRRQRGLPLPTSATEKPQHGEVVAAGPGRIEQGARVPMELQVGQQILYEPYTGIAVTFNGEQYVIITESDVLVVID